MMFCPDCDTNLNQVPVGEECPNCGAADGTLSARLNRYRRWRLSKKSATKSPVVLVGQPILIAGPFDTAGVAFTQLVVEIGEPLLSV
jgi:hypothetical protein